MGFVPKTGKSFDADLIPDKGRDANFAFAKGHGLRR